MSKSNGEASKRRGRVAAALAIIAIIVLSFLVAYESSLFSWPFASISSGNGSEPPSGGTLSTATSTIPPNSKLSVDVCTLDGRSCPGLSKALIQVFAGSSVTQIPVASNVTNSDGVFVFGLMAAQYTVKVTNSISNFTPPITLTTATGQTTNLSVKINLTTYVSTFFDIVNPYSTDELATWNPIFTQLTSTHELNSSDVSYLFFASPQQPTGLTLLNSPDTPRFGFTVVSQALTTNKLTVELRLNSVANVTNVKGVDIMTIGSSYSISQSNTSSF